MHEEIRVTIQNYMLSKFFFQKKNLHLTCKFPNKFSGLCFKTSVRKEKEKGIQNILFLHLISNSHGFSTWALPGKYNCQLYKLTLTSIGRARVWRLSRTVSIESFSGSWDTSSQPFTIIVFLFLWVINQASMESKLPLDITLMKDDITSILIDKHYNRVWILVTYGTRLSVLLKKTWTRVSSLLSWLQR